MKTCAGFSLCVLMCVTVNAYASCFDAKLNFEQNFESCSRAAEHNDALAQYYLGQMYRRGDGVAQNYELALRWYRAAAEQGNTASQYNLGWMYDSGMGVQRDESEAIRWYRMAADGGDRYAAFNLGSIFYSKGNLPENLIETYFWFGISMNLGNPKARRWMNKVVERMSGQQQQQARNRLDQWNRRNADPEG